MLETFRLTIKRGHIYRHKAILATDEESIQIALVRKDVPYQMEQGN